MPTLPNIVMTTPVLGAANGTWDDSINACFALIDAHDHSMRWVPQPNGSLALRRRPPLMETVKVAFAMKLDEYREAAKGLLPGKGKK